jgi:hypothetical protein
VGGAARALLERSWGTLVMNAEGALELGHLGNERRGGAGVSV